MSQVYRVVLVGIGGVGKSCLTIQVRASARCPLSASPSCQFIADRFVEDYDPTLEDRCASSSGTSHLPVVTRRLQLPQAGHC